MKQLTCEMCGSTDLVKDGGVFVCQNCGCKYSVEEAKKMLIEGTVKIDNSEKLNNLYTLARQARDSNDSENAAKYYDLIKQEDPNSWEAYFYNVYYRAAQTRIMFIESAANSINNCLDTVFDLIKNNSDNEEIKKLYVGEVALRVTQICVALAQSAKSTFIDSWNNSFGKYDDSVSTCTKYAKEYAARALASADAIFTCGNLIENYYSADEKMMGLACEQWKCGINIWKNIYGLYNNHAERYAEIKETIVSKILKYEPDYSFSAPQYAEFPRPFYSPLKSHSDSDFGVTNTSTSSGGCYVATAVYGSYDCPSVWTLRRYRDFTLAKSWYGRAFINFYYAISPTIVKWFGHTEWFKKLWKNPLDHMVSNLKAEGYKDTPYNDIAW